MATLRLRACYSVLVAHGSPRSTCGIFGVRLLQSRPYSSEPADPSISRYATPSRSSLPEDLKAAMNQVEEKSGFLPNVFKVLSRRPAEFRAFFAYYDALMNKDTGNLSKADREAIVVATSAANGCLYCVVAHSALHRIFSKNTMLADQIAVNWRCAELDDRLRCILEFALLVRDSHPVASSHVEKLHRHGLTDDDVWDIGAIAALFALSNRMAHLTDMRPNAEFYIMGRMKRDQPMPAGQAKK